MTGAETGNLGILDPDYLRRMGESEASIAYLTSRRPEQVSAIEPRVVPYTTPATDTGD